MPELSRIINLIMQNPALIQQIEALAKQDGEATAPDTPTEEAAPMQATDTVPAAAVAEHAHKREKRTQLLSALRPYVSEKRGKTLDTLIGMVDLFELIGRG